MVTEEPRFILQFPPERKLEPQERVVSYIRVYGVDIPLLCTYVHGPCIPISTGAIQKMQCNLLGMDG